MKSLFKLVSLTAAIVGSVAWASAQQRESELDNCTLSNYQSGHQVVLDGTVQSGGSGTFLYVRGCKYPVVIQYPSNLSDAEKDDIPALHQDDNLNKLNSELKEHPTKAVSASLFGRLDVAKPVPEGATVRLGMIYDKSGKYIGVYGFGSPVGSYKYRLVLIQVNSVTEVPAD